MAPLGAVEVRKDPNVHEWHLAWLHDVAAEGAVCSVESEAPRTYALEHVRSRMSLPRGEPAFSPSAGVIAEVAVPASSREPRSWRRVRVKERSGAVCFVAPTERMERAVRGEMMVQVSRLRPLRPAQQTSLEGRLRKVEIPVDEDLASWLPTHDADDVFGGIMSSVVAGIRSASGHKAERGLPSFQEVMRVKVEVEPQSPPHLFLIGTEAVLQQGRVLLAVALKHQLQVRRWEIAMARRKMALEERSLGVQHGLQVLKMDAQSKFRYRKFVKVSLQDMSAWMNSPDQLKVLEGKHGVETVFHYTPEGERAGHGFLEIRGNSEDDIARFADLAETVQETVSVDPAVVPWVACEEWKTVVERSGLQGSRPDPENKQLTLTGSRTACSQAKVLLEAHLGYHDAFRALEGEFTDLLAKLEAAPCDDEARATRLPAGPGALAQLQARRAQERGRWPQALGRHGPPPRQVVEAASTPEQPDLRHRRELNSSIGELKWLIKQVPPRGGGEEEEAEDDWWQEDWQRP